MKNREGYLEGIIDLLDKAYDLAVIGLDRDNRHVSSMKSGIATARYRAETMLLTVPDEGPEEA